MSLKRDPVDPRLDYLYNRTIKCPYCKTRILKYTSTCTKCGVTKEQIFAASNKRAKQIMKARTGEKIVKTARRPHDVKIINMALFLVLGLFGAHSFYVGRKGRGWTAAICAAVSIIFFVALPVGTYAASYLDAHPWRLYFIQKVLNDAVPTFPTDWPIVIALGMWVYDAFGIIVFGWYKYPVRLGEAKPVTPKPTAAPAPKWVKNKR